ncbi:MAG: HAD-IA family hydrolase [Gammaproteobacteria bacterium]|nr:MAG: HAD-IA family hydrolase [Gammaproteobacteria bacterium]
MSILDVPYAAPKTIIFDWHATLVDTHDAMYYAIDEVLPKLEELGLADQLIDIEESKTIDDAKLVKYVKEQRKLHPKIKEARKISRTDIFEILFGTNKEAKKAAHKAFDHAYRNHFGKVTAIELRFENVLNELKTMGIILAVLTNRKREFMEKEITCVDGHDWSHFFSAVVCGDDVEHRKPHPDLILKTLEELNIKPGTHAWYVGDSTTDIISAREANVTAIFYNGANWDQEWIDKIFPGTTKHPHQPDCVVNNSLELLGLAKKYLDNNSIIEHI